jgi:hypothetical protein
VPETGYLLNLVLLVLVLRNGLGPRRLTVFRQVLPLVLAIFLGLAYGGLRPANGVAELIGAVAGILCGAAAAALLKIRRSGDGSVITRAGHGYAVLWIAVIGGRCAVAYWFPSSAWVATFVLMTLTMLVTRVVVTFVLSLRARRSALSG